jgi:hypothetical protein
VAQVALISEDFKEKSGILIRPLLALEGQVIGKFHLSFQVITPFLHPNNSITKLWNEHKVFKLKLRNR